MGQRRLINQGALATHVTDPSVAYDPLTGDFLVVGMTLDPPQCDIVVARWDSATEQFDPWQVVAQGAPGPDNFFDKSWIVRGASVSGDAPTPTEFYIAWKGAVGYTGHLSYLRSRDGGVTWRGGHALTDVNVPTSSYGFAQHPAPRVYLNRQLYVAYSDDNGRGIARGDDVNTGPHAGEVQFTRLQFIDSMSQPLAGIPYNHEPVNLYAIVPGPNAHGGNNVPNGPGFDLAVDPTNADRLYFVYQDTLSPGHSDVNIYLRVLTFVSGSTWRVGDRILVADDGLPAESDQFMPAIDVDFNGRIHIIFYDDRNFAQDDSQEFDTKFDLFYAWASAGGGDFDQLGHLRELCDDPEYDCASTEPAIHFQDPAVAPGFLFPLRDYIGIDARGDRVWTSFMGNSALRDPNPQKSLIWSSQVLLP